LIITQNCKNNPDKFCFICGSFTTKGQQRKITSQIKNIYQLYFGYPLENQDKDWAPHIVCNSCSSGLRDWINEKKTSMPFAIPMIWREQKNHIDDCYFCLVKTAGYSTKNKKKIEYPNLCSAIRPVPHNNNLPVPKPPCNFTENFEDCDMDIDSSCKEDSDYEFIPESTTEPQLFSQFELNDLIRDLSLSKDKAELLASRLKEKNLVEKNVKVSLYRKRNFPLTNFFEVDGPMVYCSDVGGLFHDLKSEHNPEEWRLFIDSSLRSLKAVLLHNGNTKPSIPIAHSVHLTESYENIKTVLEAIKYDDHQWNICGDLKVIGTLMGLQGGFTKYSCFLCLWNSRSTDDHYIKREWDKRLSYEHGKYNIQNSPLVKPEKIFLPPLHIKLGLMKTFVKTMGKANTE
jgi:hypothetical protein